MRGLRDGSLSVASGVPVAATDWGAASSPSRPLRRPHRHAVRQLRGGARACVLCVLVAVEAGLIGRARQAALRHVPFDWTCCSSAVLHAIGRPSRCRGLRPARDARRATPPPRAEQFERQHRIVEGVEGAPAPAGAAAARDGAQHPHRHPAR